MTREDIFKAVVCDKCNWAQIAGCCDVCVTKKAESAKVERVYNLMREDKAKLIEKAADWLRMTMDFFNNGEFNTDKFINDFKQEMEEQL